MVLYPIITSNAKFNSKGINEYRWQELRHKLLEGNIGANLQNLELVNDVSDMKPKIQAIK